MIYNGCHCQLPIVQKYNDSLRIYISDRNDCNKSFIRYLTVDAVDPKIVKDISGPIIVGTAGNFDQDGVMTSCCVSHHDFSLMYYTGWRVGGKYPYQHTIGVALTSDGHNFIKHPFPVFQSTNDDYYLCSSPWVMIDAGLWRMWYICGRGCGGWTSNGPQYTIHYAESVDGQVWTNKDIHFPRLEYEVFARPFVVKTKTGYQMWYSRLILEENKRYLIGYAESTDGLSWVRKDNESGITVSESGWDSQMVAFPFIYNDWLFYAGNNFGGAGIGYAIR